MNDSVNLTLNVGCGHAFGVPSHVGGRGGKGGVGWQPFPPFPPRGVVHKLIPINKCVPSKLIAVNDAVTHM